MKQLNDNQFSGYEFRVNSDVMSTSASVAHEGEPLGSISIYRPGFYAAETDQKAINQGRSRHRTGEERIEGDTRTGVSGGSPNYSAQQRWTGGMMDPYPAEVGWLGASSALPKMAFRGMIATAVHAHGSVPAADTTMSEPGARMARGAAKKYGMKGTSGNPDMRATFPGYGEHSDQTVRDAASDSWTQYDADVETEKHYAEIGYPVTPTRNWQTFNNRQAHEVVQAMDEKYRKKAPPKTSPLSPGQMGLF